MLRESKISMGTNFLAEMYNKLEEESSEEEEILKHAKFFKGLNDLRNNFSKLSLKEQVGTFFAILWKVVGYRTWDKVTTPKEIIVKLVKDRKKFLDAVEATGQLHPDKMDYYRRIKEKDIY